MPKADLESGFWSSSAAGVGLNIQSANHVIHHTRKWNPAQVKQATDRVYRIGQTHDSVHKYVPIAVSSDDRETADERLDKLLERKRQMGHAILRPGERTTASASEFEDLLT